MTPLRWPTSCSSAWQKKAGTVRLPTLSAGPALRIMDEDHAFDVVVVDLMLPGEPGMIVLERCRASSTPAAVFTALDEQTARKYCRPGIPILTKPYDLDRLEAVLHRPALRPGRQ